MFKWKVGTKKCKSPNAKKKTAVAMMMNHNNAGDTIHPQDHPAADKEHQQESKSKSALKKIFNSSSSHQDAANAATKTDESSKTLSAASSGTLMRPIYDQQTLTKVGMRLATVEPPPTILNNQHHSLQKGLQNNNTGQKNDDVNRSAATRHPIQALNQYSLEHWSSHGYLSKKSSSSVNQVPLKQQEMENEDDNGYVLLKRQNAHLTNGFGDMQTKQPHSLPPHFSQQANHHHQHNQHQEALYHELTRRPQIEPRSLDGQESRFLQPKENNLTWTHSLRGVRTHYYPSQQPPTRPNHQHSDDHSKSGNKNSVTWTEWTQQLNAYIAWVNSQLRKRPECKMVNDLRTDLQNGVTLAHLIEIISGESVTGIQMDPKTFSDMRDNLDRILHFMAARKIRMHQITSRELLDGNLKAVMRLILALAAHYKPQSVRHHENAQQEQYSPKSNKDSQQEDDSMKDKDSSGDFNTADEAVASQDQVTETIITKVSTIASETECMSTQTDPINYPEDDPRKEDKFMRTGSGRKLPNVPRSLSVTVRDKSGQDKEGEADKQENRKSRPKALEFWETLQAINSNNRNNNNNNNNNVSNGPTYGSDIKYNTIHRMSTGRRMLPKTPMKSINGGIDANLSNDEMNCSFDTSSDDVASMKSSTSLMTTPILPLEPLYPSGVRHPASTISNESRGQIEGSSAKNSPPSSVIQTQELQSLNMNGIKDFQQSEYEIAKDAIANLRRSFEESDPNQHILDTLEECLSILSESKLSINDNERPNGTLFENHLSKKGVARSTPTKILYFTSRSVTPFMSTLEKAIGEITLRDFKAIFDRPGFFRFHFKAVDEEFGVVKQEISQDDAILPGSDGKIVSWVEEEE